jgi:NAD(P)H-hydrate epimerase
VKITTAEEMSEIDRRTTAEFGVPSLTLMENAGGGVAEFVLRRYPRAERIAVICGKGNNGGDGFVAARKLREAGKRVSVLLLADPAEVKGDAAAMLTRMPMQPVVIKSAAELDGMRARECFESELLLDAILGTGFKPPVEGLYAAAIERLNTAKAPVFAVDIPSGANADAFAPEEHLRCRADAIVTFTAPRPAHVFGDLTRGEIVVVPIGSPADAIQSSLNLDVISWPDIASCFALRKPDANKGNFGHVLAIGGSVGKSGAAAMAGMGALRVGAGLSTVATPKSVQPLVAGFAAELMTEPLAETDVGTISAGQFARLDMIVSGKTVIALGPGISRNAETVEFIRAVVAKYELPLVVDADGLNAFEGCADKLNGSKRPLVVTPHPGEMARLAGLSTKQVQEDRIGTARRFAREHKCVVVLKGHRTLVAEPAGHVWVNMTGNPGMATGGTGDVLTGFIAGMIAQFPSELVKAVCAAIWLHGWAGDKVKRVWSEQWLTATDLLTMAAVDEATKEHFAEEPFASLLGEHS